MARSDTVILFLLVMVWLIYEMAIAASGVCP